MTTKHKIPKITLMGAGPGNPDLISLAGIKALRSADIVLYDALVHPELLKHVQPGIRKIPVGKRKGKASLSQEQINNLLVDFAFSYGHVVRLKGGDPYVFGRGGEELDYAGNFNIPVDYIPGISSAFSVPGLAGIPLTRRGINQGFLVITGTDSKGKLSKAVYEAARQTFPVVILMGLSQLKRIAELFKSAGKENTPLAVILNGSLKNSRTIKSTVGKIAHDAPFLLQEGPGIIVIGEIAGPEPEKCKAGGNAGINSEIAASLFNHQHLILN